MKQRNKKTIDDKYEKKSLINDYLSFIKGKINQKEIFDTMPYLGVFYLPVEIPRRIKFFCDYEKYDIENKSGGLIKCKVLDNNSSHHMRFMYYDNHNNTNIICEIYKDDYYLEGNILKERYST